MDSLIVGQRTGKLTLLKFIKRTNGGSWLCHCDCGKELEVYSSDLTNRKRKSCGCGAHLGGLKHGLSGTAEHRIWSGMVARCTQPRQTAYPYYGGRGIKVCDRWLNFQDFLTDVGKRPGPTYSLDRINPDGDYELSNVRWASPFEQYANRRFRYMTIRQYQHKAGETAIYPGRGEMMGLIYTVLGIAGEAGELSNKTKKVFRDSGFELTADLKKGMLEEAGDCLWYLSQFCQEMDVTLEDIARANLAKLEDRKTRGVIKGDGDNR